MYICKYKAVTTFAWTIKPGNWHLPVLNLKILALCTQYMVSERDNVKKRVGCGAGPSEIPCLHLMLLLFCPVNFFSPNLLYLFLCSSKMGEVNIATFKGAWNFLLIWNIKGHTLLSLYISIEGNNLIWVLTCKKKCLGLVFKKHLN